MLFAKKTFSVKQRKSLLKTLQNKGQIDCTRGVSREQRAIDRRNKLESFLSSRGDGLKRSSGRKTRLSHFEEKIRKCESFNIEVSRSSFCGIYCSNKALTLVVYHVR